MGGGGGFLGVWGGGVPENHLFAHYVGKLWKCFFCTYYGEGGTQIFVHIFPKGGGDGLLSLKVGGARKPFLCTLRGEFVKIFFLLTMVLGGGVGIRNVCSDNLWWIWTRAYLRGGVFKPLKIFIFILKSEGKEVERKMKSDVGGGGIEEFFGGPD